MLDKSGREYAKLHDLYDGQIVEVDSGFDCMLPGPQTVCTGVHGPYIKCAHGRHWLSGQADDGIHCVGVYPLSTPK